MKSDLNHLLQSNNLDAIVIVGPGYYNPAMVYMTGGAHLSDAYLIKKRGEPATLYHRAMERDEAKKTSLQTRLIEDFNQNQSYVQNERNRLQFQVALIRKMLEDSKINAGRIAIYGQYEIGKAYTIFSTLQTEMPELTFVGELEDGLLWTAMATKDQTEIDRIRKMGLITTEVVTEVADYLTHSKHNGEILLKIDSTPFTIGDLRKKINIWLTERNAENPKGTIFSIGYDAGVPHSIGNDNDYLELGKTIIFDIFPCEAGGGYFYDFTRTWCLGYASDEIYQIYEDVHEVYTEITRSLVGSTPFKNYQNLACDLFEAQGHKTIRQSPQTQSGYVHHIGHGLGLQIHEPPFSRSTSGEHDYLFPGTVFTIEPGLYYPELEIGVRLEDTYVVKSDGSLEIMAEYPLDLVLPIG